MLDKDNGDRLEEYLAESDFVIHLAGVNRCKDPKEFSRGNVDLTKSIVDTLVKLGKRIPVLFVSSIQATLDNDYGRSKKAAEDILLQSGLPVKVVRLKNVFGPGCRPNYNSVVATFAYNIAHDLPIHIDDPAKEVCFQYVDDVAVFLEATIRDMAKGRIEEPLSVYEEGHLCSLTHLADLLKNYKEATKTTLELPTIHNPFELNLFVTYCFYANGEGLHLNRTQNDAGSFTELYKSLQFGQISLNCIAPHRSKGGHYHTRKKETFLVAQGRCKITQREGEEFQEDIVDASDARPIEIAPGFTHWIENLGDDEAKVLIHIDEIYDPENADTYR